MSTKTSVDTMWHIPDDLWSLIAPILGAGETTRLPWPQADTISFGL